MAYKIIPGILAKNLEDYKEKLEVLKPVSDKIHVDLADGRVVANRTLSLSEIVSTPTESSQILHMMVENPRNYLDQLSEDSSIEEIIFHLDWEEKPYFIFDFAAERPLKISLAISPVLEDSAGLEEVAPFAEMLHSVLVMGIVPGFTGQPFRPEILKVLYHLRKEFPHLTLAVDGGMNENTVPLVVKAGASIVYATSAILRSKDPKRALEDLSRCA